jgi:hypothetical protein
MSAQPLAAVVKTCREIVGDQGTTRGQLIRTEKPEGKIDGTNKRFRLQFFPVQVVPPATFTLLKNGAPLATPGDYTLTAAQGIVDLVVAPVAGPPADILDAAYSWIWFNDEQYHEWIYSSAQHCGIYPPTTGDPAARAAAAVLAVPDGLMDALRLWVACAYNYRRADEHAHETNSSAGGQSVSTSSKTGQFEKLAKDFCDRAVRMRDDYAKRRGAREAPASANSGFNPILRYTPPR